MHSRTRYPWTPCGSPGALSLRRPRIEAIFSARLTRSRIRLPSDWRGCSPYHRFRGMPCLKAARAMGSAEARFFWFWYWAPATVCSSNTQLGRVPMMGAVGQSQTRPQPFQALRGIYGGWEFHPSSADYYQY